MRICVYGAGAIGSYLGAKLADSGCEVTLIARGPHLEAMRENGLTLEEDGGSENFRISCTDDAESAGVQDYVILTLKAHSVAPVVGDIATLLGPGTPVVTAQNGILWWYFHGLPGPWQSHHLETADAGGHIWNTLGPERAIGCVVYPSCRIVSPGIVRHTEGNRFMLGEPDGSRSSRITKLSDALSTAGLKAPIRKRIRDDIWFKLLGNATFNPVSVLTSATLEQMGQDTSVRALVRDMMQEVQQVAVRLGVKFPMGLDRRIDGAAAVGAHKTSMLQDFEAGRPMEVDALVASVAEIARLVEVSTPKLDTVLALLRLKTEARGGTAWRA